MLRECSAASNLSATSRACRAGGIWRTTRHTDKRAALYTAADRRPTDRISVWQAERRSRPSLPTRATSSRICRACRACQRGCHEDATRKLFPWNLSFSIRRVLVHLAYHNDGYPVINNDISKPRQASAWVGRSGLRSRITASYI